MSYTPPAGWSPTWSSGPPPGFPTSFPGSPVVSSPLDVGNIVGVLQGFGINIDDVREWITLGQAVLDAYRAVNDTGSTALWGHRPYSEVRPFDLCPGTPSFDAVRRAVLAMPEADIQWIVRHLKEGNEGKGPGSRGELADVTTLPNWVKALLGGTDCRNGRFPAAPADFVALVARYGVPEGEELPNQPVGPWTGPPTLQAGGGAALAGLALVGAFLLFGRKGRR